MSAKWAYTVYNANIGYIIWAVNQHIIMISEGSCDTQDRSNDAENSVLITGINDVYNCNGGLRVGAVQVNLTLLISRTR